MKYNHFQAHPNSSINSLCLVKNTNFVLTGGGNDCLVKLHNLDEGLSEHETNSITFPKSHTNSINAINTSSSNDFFITASNDIISTFDLVKQTKLHVNTNAPTNDITVPPSQVRDQVLDCKVLLDSMIVACGVNHHLNFFDLKQPQMKKPVYSINLGEDNLNSLDFTDPPTEISVASSNGKLYSVDLRNQKVITDSFDSNCIVNVSKYQPDLNLLRFSNGVMTLFDSTTNEKLALTPITREKSYRLNAQLIPEIGCVVNGTEDGIVQTWQWNRAKHALSLFNELKIESINSTPENILNNVQYDSSNNRLVCSSGSGQLHVWTGIF